MEPESPNASVAEAQAQQVIADTVCIEIDLGMTFLDVAENTRDPRHAWQSVKNAITALRTANRFLARIQPTANIDAIRQRREELAKRLRAITGMADSGR
jgi:hypothetical protein